MCLSPGGQWASVRRVASRCRRRSFCSSRASARAKSSRRSVRVACVRALVGWRPMCVTQQHARLPQLAYASKLALDVLEENLAGEADYALATFEVALDYVAAFDFTRPTAMERSPSTDCRALSDSLAAPVDLEESELSPSSSSSFCTAES